MAKLLRLASRSASCVDGSMFCTDVCPTGDGQAERIVLLLTETLYRPGIPRSGSLQASRQISLSRLSGTTVGCASLQHCRSSLMRNILSFMYAIWLMTAGL